MDSAIAVQPAPGHLGSTADHGTRNREPRWLRLQLARGGLVGLLAGVIALGFALLIHMAEHGRHSLLKWAHIYPAWGWTVLPALAALATGLIVWATQRFCPEAAGSGIPHVKRALDFQAKLRWQRLLPVKLLGGVAAIGAGLSLGREGPTVQLGAAAGQYVAQLLKLPRRQHGRMISAGAGAGMAAAFNAPLAGFIFIIEELQRDFSPLTYTLALIACVAADVVARGFFGQEAVFSVHNVVQPPLAALPVFVFTGALAAVVGWGFSSWLVRLHEWAISLSLRWRIAFGCALAAVIGLLAWFIPQAAGGGYATAQQILAQPNGERLGVGLLLGLFGLRFALTILSYATGAPGGIFAPMLAMGATLGLALGTAASQLFPHATGIPLACAVVGMAALFSAVVRAPLTGIVMIIELTGNYSLLLPLMAGGLTAYILAERLGYAPVYDALLVARPVRRKAPEKSEPTT